MTPVRIVVVEDESVVAKDIQRRLKGLGYAVAAAVASGQEAIQAVQTMQPDMVLMDIILKGEMDGVEAAGHIRQRFGTPVVYLTAHSDEATLQRAKITEPFGYLVKPFEERDLHITIEMALYKHRTERRLAWESGLNAAMAELARALISPLSLDDISTLVLEQAKQLTGSTLGMAGYLRPHTGQMVGATLGTGGEGDQASDAPGLRQVFQTMVEWAAQQSQPLLINQVGQGQSPAQILPAIGAAPTHPSIQQFVSAPAMLGQTQLGQIALANPGRDYTPEDLALVERLAALYALAIHRTRIEEDIRDLNKNLEDHVVQRTTQLVAANTALQQSEAKFRSLVESADDIITLQDAADGHFEFVHIPQRYTLPAQDIQGKLPRHILPPELAESYMNSLNQVVRTGDPHTFEGDLMWGSQRLHFLTMLSAIKDNEGRVSAVMGIGRDITEQKQLQAKMMHADRLSAVGKLAASVAHEINNPLQSVIGCLGLAEEALADGEEDADQYLRVASEEVRRIARIVARMRDLYRPESGLRRPSDVNQLVEQVLELSRKRCQESRVEVDWRPGADLPPILVAPDQIKQVFLNLLLNAIDAMPGGGGLEVSTTHVPDQDSPHAPAQAGVDIHFRDNGVGIPADVLPRIFETFYSTKPEGSGLGLSISSNIVEQHGGRIDVQSQAGKGSTFSVWLPA